MTTVLLKCKAILNFKVNLGSNGAISTLRPEAWILLYSGNRSVFLVERFFSEKSVKKKLIYYTIFFPNLSNILFVCD